MKSKGSKNKDIKFYKKLTGSSFKDCRNDMKNNHWDWWLAWLSKKGGVQDNA